MTHTVENAIAKDRSAVSIVWPNWLAFVLGLIILFVTGFASINAVHDAAHDSRHSFAFPCH